MLTTADQSRIQPLPIFRMAIWLGLVVGFLELLAEFIRVEAVQNGIYRKGPHLIWAIPLADLAFFSVVGIVLAVAAWRLPRICGRAAIFVLCALAPLTVLLAMPGLGARASLVLSVGAAAWLAPWLGARAVSFSRLIRRTLPVLLLILFALWSVDAGSKVLVARRAAAPRRPAPDGTPNVLLIVMDTVRADATSLHGAARDTTPNLAALAKRGVRFERAIATAPWTLPSHSSMFTGRWSWEVSVGPDRALDDSFLTLAEYLQSQGYATAGFIANTVFCATPYGLSQGFGHYEDYVVTPLEIMRTSALGWLLSKRLCGPLDRVYQALGRAPRHPLEIDYFRKDAARINRDALRWIHQPRDRPFFVFLNYLDAHDPYLPPQGYDTHFGRRPETLADYRVLRDWMNLDKQPLSATTLQMARDGYDDCLSYLDREIGKLVDDLERRGVLENTLVIITSDHGEHFGEHEIDGKALYGHRASVYQPEIHVPLLILEPGATRAGSVVSEPVSLRDLPATVVDLVGFRENPPFPGASLAGTWRRTRSSTGPVLSEFAVHTENPPGLRYVGAPPGLMRAVIADRSAYLRFSDRHEELYDLVYDPGESSNLAGAAARDLNQLRTTLDALCPGAVPDLTGGSRTAWNPRVRPPLRPVEPEALSGHALEHVTAGDP